MTHRAHVHPGLFSVHAATAVCIPFNYTQVVEPNRIWFSEPYLRVEVPEREAAGLRRGSYVEHDGTVRKVVRVDRPSDWGIETVTLVLEDGVHEHRAHAWGAHAWDVRKGQFHTLLGKLPAAQWLDDSWDGLPR